jgi:hypothetical protein
MKTELKNVWKGYAIAIASMAVCLGGCRSAGDRLQEEIDKLPWRTDDHATPAVTPENPTPDLPAEPVPAETDGFVWEPRADSVRIVIPGALPHWQLTIVTLSTHHTVYGPDHSGRGRSGEVEYILPGSGADWAAKAVAECPRHFPSVMVYINTDAMQETGHRSAGWRIMDPSQRVVGDISTRLQPGQNK